MFERLEIRKVANGFVLTVDTGEEEKEYVFDTQRKLFRFIKEKLDGSGN